MTDELQRPDLTITEAAKAARVDRRTIRRRLDADTFPNAYRQGPDGPWKIPVGDLITAGFPLHKSEPERAPAPAPTLLDNTELDRLRDENAELRRRAEVAEAVAAERLLRAENAELALRALTAPTAGTDVAHVVPSSRRGTPPPNAEQARRRWWNRR